MAKCIKCGEEYRDGELMDGICDICDEIVDDEYGDEYGYDHDDEYDDEEYDNGD